YFAESLMNQESTRGSAAEAIDAVRSPASSNEGLFFIVFDDWIGGCWIKGLMDYWIDGWLELIPPSILFPGLLLRWGLRRLALIATLRIAGRATESGTSG